jgi:hypothetical protein
VRCRSRPLALGVYESATAPIIFHKRDEVTELFSGWRLVLPGLVPTWQWHSKPNESPRTGWLWAGVIAKDA